MATAKFALRRPPAVTWWILGLVAVLAAGVWGMVIVLTQGLQVTGLSDRVP